MSFRFLVCCLLLLTSALAGCSSTTHPTASSSSAPTSSQTGTAGPPILTPPVGKAPLPKLELTDCTGFEGTSQPFPRSVAPGQAPPGWDPKDPSVPLSYVLLFGYDCHRVHLGSIERGPIRIVVEGHNHADIPGSCLTNETGVTHSAIVHLLLVNDTDLAAALQNQLGLPASYAKIDASAQDAGAVKQTVWSWGPAGQTASTLTVTADSTTQPYDFPTRLFWQRNNGLGTLDISYPHRDGPTVTAREAHGIMQPPMLLASQPGGAFVGTMAYFPAMTGEGGFRLFTDYSCKSLESSS